MPSKSFRDIGISRKTIASLESQVSFRFAFLSFNILVWCHRNHTRKTCLRAGRHPEITYFRPLIMPIRCLPHIAFVVLSVVVTPQRNTVPYLDHIPPLRPSGIWLCTQHSTYHPSDRAFVPINCAFESMNTPLFSLRCTVPRSNQLLCTSAQTP